MNNPIDTNSDFTSLGFDLPKNQSNVIKVIGVGGGGSNAINYMFNQGIKGVDFVICNTDAQALQNSGVPNKIQLGVNLTEGLGAGANPEIGAQSAIESYDDIRRMLETNTKMIFITAGMGGGTGTGAAPVIAKMAKDLDILTVGIVTMPFQFEGKLRNDQAHKGLEKLRKVVDSLIVINNNNLREVYGNLGFKAGFSKADEVLATAARGIAEVITHHYTQNIDLRDAKTVLSNSGTAIMGSANASGSNRAQEAITKALDSPLLNDNKITGAKNVLLLIVSGEQEITIDEIGEINDHIQTEAGYGANIIMGVGEDKALEDAISVTVIATGFNVDQQDEITNTEVKKVIHTLEDEQTLEQDFSVEKPFKTSIVESKKEIIKHVLEDDTETVNNSEKNQNEHELIPTTNVIKNIKVVYEEVIDVKPIQENVFQEDDNEIENTAIEKQDPIIAEDDFVINDITQAETTTNTTIEEDKQITLTFDLPISEQKLVVNEDAIIHNLTNEAKDVEVNDYIELVPIHEANEETEIRYTLDGFVNVESKMNKHTQTNPVEGYGEEVAFERKTIEEITHTKTIVEPVNEAEDTVVEKKEVDPLNSPISDLLKERAEERKLKMKDFNYKFNNAKIDDMEKVPAYKRQGVDLEETQHSSEDNISNSSLSIDDNDDLQLRRNNSFLHDNVD